MKAKRSIPGTGLPLFVAAFLLILAAGAATAPPAAVAGPNPARTAEEAMATFDRFIDRYIAKDLDGVMALHDRDVTAVGTNRDEQYVGSEALRKAYARDFAAMDKIRSIGWSVLSSGAQGTVAWVAADVRVSFVARGKDRSIAGRLTAVLRKKGKNWLIVQTHYSLPADETVRMDVMITFQQIDANGDGRISFEEVRVWIRNITPEAFQAADRSGDGYLSREEFELLRKR